MPIKTDNQSESSMEMDDMPANASQPTNETIIIHECDVQSQESGVMDNLQIPDLAAAIMELTEEVLRQFNSGSMPPMSVHSSSESSDEIVGELIVKWLGNRQSEVRNNVRGRGVRR